MKKFLVLSAIAAMSLSATVTMDTYEVTVMEVALCKAPSTTDCVPLGSGSKTFNIASATAGADVGSYISQADIPDGTYDRLKIKISQTFRVKGCLDNKCTSETGRATTSLGGITIDYMALNNTTADANPVTLTRAIPGNAGSLVSLPAGFSFDTIDSSSASMYQVITNPITIASDKVPPSIKIGFNMESALTNYSGTALIVTPPTITLEVK